MSHTPEQAAHVLSSAPGRKPAPSLLFLWLLPLAFALHDGEEVLTLAAWVRSHRPLMEEIAALGPLPANIVANLPTHWTEVAGAAGFEFFILLSITGLLARQKTKRLPFFLYTAFLGAFGLHVITHGLQALWIRGYTPGVLSALLVIPPVVYFIYRRLHTVFFLTGFRALIHALAGVLLLLPLVMVAHKVGRALVELVD